MKNKPTIFDENVEEVRRVRREASRRFKSFDEMWQDALRFEKKFFASKKPGIIDQIVAATEAELLANPAGCNGKPVLIDENVEEIRRIRREISSEFKTFDEFFADIYKRDRARLRREKASRAKNGAQRKGSTTRKANAATRAKSA